MSAPTTNAKMNKEKKESPLFVAICRGQADTARDLIAAGADVRVKAPSNFTALHWACINGLASLVEPLVTAGANPNALDYNGMTPLIAAMMNDRWKTFQHLINTCKKLNVALDLNKANIFGEAAVHYAATHGHLKYLKCLSENGANLNLKLPGAPSPLSLAKECRHPLIIKYLQQNGAQEIPDVKPNINAILGEFPPFIVKDTNLYHKDERMLQNHERAFGGALWGSHLECFYAPKKPKVYMAVEFNAHLKNSAFKDVRARKNGPTFTWFRGFISSVSDDHKEFKATLNINCDHQQYSEMNREWEATAIFYPYLNNPWILKSLVPLPSGGKTFKQLEQEGLADIALRGRRVPIISTPEEEKCAVLKGTQPEGDDFELVTEVDVTTDPKGVPVHMIQHYEGGRTVQINDPRIVRFLMQQMADQAVTFVNKPANEVFILRINANVVNLKDMLAPL
eukprot:TRINITY_DN1574_c0_g1_i1.p1 TRINITY_DN1574_c0_g1~~TRINITY_DN1574_c0_g1_i1.p1  ORF type:complete len:453 (-),score=101.62 TRINITY_DN1574_c0_g1_i1:761-2119(-)